MNFINNCETYHTQCGDTLHWPACVSCFIHIPGKESIRCGVVLIESVLLGIYWGGRMRARWTLLIK